MNAFHLAFLSASRAPRPARRGLRAAWLVVLLVSLLLAQGLGLVHRVAHARGLPEPAAAAATLADTPGAASSASRSAHPHAHSAWGERLFGHDEAGCRLYDALGHAGPVGVLPALPTGLPEAAPRPWPLVAVAPAAATTPFDARGPPARN